MQEDTALNVSPTKVDVEKTVGVITLAFSADPVVRWVYPSASDHHKHFPRFVRAFAGGAFDAGTAYVAGDYFGAALWLPPGVHSDDEALGSIVEETIDDSLQDPLAEMLELQHACHPAGPHWYLPLIGVDPIHQGKGFGSQLLTRALAEIDRQGLPAYLEATTAGSRALYARHGFEVVREIQVPGSPPMWPMVRPPS
jgi:GNAT superfamily N-acetyltransferase